MSVELLRDPDAPDVPTVESSEHHMRNVMHLMQLMRMQMTRTLTAQDYLPLERLLRGAELECIHALPGLNVTLTLL
jgi:triphosphoribosyl-dephospho-CoA synthetase